MIDNDNVSNPSHYTDGKIEVIDFIEDKKLGFNLGNVIKYVSRAGKKKSNNPNKHVEDLEKAKWYLDREIKLLKKKNSNSQSNEKQQGGENNERTQNFLT